MEDFRKWYNREREHYALDYQCPENVYQGNYRNVKSKVILDTHMANMEQVNEDEFKRVKTRKKDTKRMSQRERTRRRYCRYLEKFDKGAYVEVTLKAGEKRQTEKNRLQKVAEDLVLTLVFKRTKGKMRFQVK